jgi:hypothetical protein
MAARSPAHSDDFGMTLSENRKTAFRGHAR